MARLCESGNEPPEQQMLRVWRYSASEMELECQRKWSQSQMKDFPLDQPWRKGHGAPSHCVSCNVHSTYGGRRTTEGEVNV
ncbi:hypothetical protein ANN_25920 [Periplaneta americana]|uniref:Uncharacterized protein n=1 Tax=Periplaneta americana TaxID=6978 RepID=A0ABQ8S4I4_PERAM|nr:hypothetical protein ANN_25920 [Periplaneta americana]